MSCFSENQYEKSIRPLLNECKKDFLKFMTLWKFLNLFIEINSIRKR